MSEYNVEKKYCAKCGKRLKNTSLYIFCKKCYKKIIKHNKNVMMYNMRHQKYSY